MIFFLIFLLVSLASFSVHEAKAFQNSILSKMLLQRQKYAPLRSLQSSIDQDETGAGKVPYDTCLQMAAEEATIGNTCTCNLFEDGMVQLDCIDNCIYCSDGDTSSSCANFSYSTNVTENMAFGQVHKATFQYDGEGDRNEILSFEEDGCKDDGVCDSCRIYVNGSLCNSCSFCTADDQQGSLLQQGLVVDCENVIASSSFDYCTDPPGPGVFELVDYNIVDCIVPPPPNDNCNDANCVSPGDVVAGTLNGAVTDSTPFCPAEKGVNGVWYTFGGTGTPILLSTCSESVLTETLINVYQGSDCGVLECVAGSYQDSSCGGLYNGGSTVSLVTLANTRYFIFVSDRYGSFGPFELRFMAFPRAANSQCPIAEEIAVDASPQSGTIESHPDVDPHSVCGEPSMDNDGEAWYRFVASENTTLRASTCSGSIVGWTSSISIAAGDCDNLSCVAASDLYVYSQECGQGGNFIDFDVVAGESYHAIVWGPLFADVGLFELGIRSLHPPQNDMCENAEMIDIDSNLTGSFADVTMSSDEGDVACLEQVITETNRGGIWYSLVGTGDFVVAKTCSKDFSFFTSIYSGSCGELECVIPATLSYDNQCQSLPWETEVGQVYYVLISSTGSSLTGTFEFSTMTFFPAENDNCAGAIEVVPDGQLIAASTENALYEAYDDTCTPSFRSPGLWYIVNGTGDMMRAHTCSDSTNFDTVISVYRGLCGGLECIGTDDDSCARAASSITWDTELSVTYYIRVHGFGDSVTGDFGLIILPFEPAVNDLCDGAMRLVVGEEVEGSLEGASDQIEESFDCFYGYNQPSLWYYIEGTGTALHVSMCLPNGTLSGGVQVFAGSNCSDLLCEGFPSDGNFPSDYNCAYPSPGARFFAEDGERYHVVISTPYLHNADANSSSFTLRVTEFEITENDICQTALPINISDSPIIGSNYDAFPDNITCGYYYGNYPAGVWYSVIGTGNSLVASTCSDELTFDASLYVFSGACEYLECIASGIPTYDGCGQSLFGSSRVVFRTQFGEEYFVLVGGGYSLVVSGDFGLTITEAVAPPNDLCPGAIELQPDSGKILGSLSNATGFLGLNYFCIYSDDMPGVWYSLIGTGDVYAITTCSSELNFDSGISLSSGTCDNQECIPFNAYSSIECRESLHISARILFRTEIGVEYLIAVQGLNYQSQGEFGLTVSTVEVPPNDECSSAVAILPVNQGTIYGSITNATSFPTNNSFCGISYDAPNVWYTLVGTGDVYAISTCSRELNFDSGISVSTGTCDNQECVASSAYPGFECTETFNIAGRVIFHTEVGVEYFISVEGLNYPSQGEFGLTTSIVEVPPNDDCSSAMVIPLNNGTIYGSITNAAGFYGLNFSCSYTYAAPTIWYSMIGTGDAYAISTCSKELNFDSGLFVTTGTCDSQECINSNSYSSVECTDTFFGTVKVVLHSEIGVEYFIALQGVNFPSQGDFSLSITTVEVPSNDLCSGALVIAADNSAVFGSTEFATSSGITNTSCTGFDASPDLWYRVEGTGTLLTASLCGETTVYDSKIAVVEGIGDECDGRCIISNDDFCGTSSEVQWFAELGMTYFIRVYGFLESRGPFELRVF